MLIFVGTIFIGSLLALILLMISHVPKVIGESAVNRIFLGHVWVNFASYLKEKFLILGKSLWHFILEAKDMRPPKILNEQVEKVKKAFKVRVRKTQEEPIWLPEAEELSTIDSHEDITTPEDIYLKAIKKNPHKRDAYEGLGRLYMEEKKYSEAIETFKYLIAQDPGKDVYWSNLGLCYYLVQDFKQAIDSYERALNINSKVPMRWVNLSFCFDALDEHTKAIKAVLQALEIDQNNINYLNLLADLYLKVPNKIRAEEVLEKILEIDPTNRTVAEKLTKIKL